MKNPERRCSGSGLIHRLRAARPSTMLRHGGGRASARNEAAVRRSMSSGLSVRWITCSSRSSVRRPFAGYDRGSRPQKGRARMTAEAKFSAAQGEEFVRLAMLVACAMTMALSAALAQPSTTRQQLPNPPPNKTPASMPKPELQGNQSALAKAGYNPGTTDRAWTPRSATALGRFQANRALPAPNGKVVRSVFSASGLQ